ncbi:MAG: 16S rRNA (uracil(1498)-N(3))-methyltransferase [Micromonosporaceae bacterium]|jgi:16S rRNA (uracil1498-N3)-methyltransferase|nr:16S rRNA (uracil(1498)-N(3))-methyltransferase [Micromonosporaceae bacterium]
MSRPLFLVDALPTEDTYTLDGPEGHHAAAVQRLRAGEELTLGDGRGGTATAVVIAAGRDSLTVSITGRAYARPPDPRLVVVQALAKGDRGELAVQAMTEVGVDEIVPWAAARCVVQWRGDRGERARHRWVATAREAAKQSRRPWLPALGPAGSTRQVVDRVGAAAAGLVLDPESATRISTVDLPTTGEIVLVVGPEGGIAPAELAAFEAAGARPVRLGDTVLRTSTAGVAALAVLAARIGRW